MANVSQAPSRPSVVALFFVLFLTAGFVMSLISVANTRLPENQSLLTGKWAQAFESEFDEALPTRQVSINTWSAIEYGLFKNGRDGVLVGSEGWLFSREEFAHYPEGQRAIDDKLELAKRAQDILANQGANFMVVLVPAKARIYPEYLGRYTYPSYQHTLYEDFARALDEAQVPHINLLEGFADAKAQEDVFLKTDTHWTPYGAEMSAQEIARIVKKQNLLPSMGSSQFETTVTEIENHEGDLLNFIPLGHLQETIGPAFDKLERRTTEQVSATEGGGLFGDVNIPVTLVGTSYSANPRWNFEGAIKESLGADVLNLADEGAGPVVPLENYLAGSELGTSPPELVIWELPERFLPVSYD